MRLVGLSVLFLIGCGGGGHGPGPGGPGGPAVYPLVQSVYEDVPPGSCLIIEGPYTLPASTMAFTVDDTPGAGYDAMEVGVIRDADYYAAGCDFTRALVDDVFYGSYSDSGPAAASTYDFMVGCDNYLLDCVFNLTWTATY
jgi:hypothetical protein